MLAMIADGTMAKLSAEYLAAAWCKDPASIPYSKPGSFKWIYHCKTPLRQMLAQRLYTNAQIDWLGFVSSLLGCVLAWPSALRGWWTAHFIIWVLMALGGLAFTLW